MQLSDGEKLIISMLCDLQEKLGVVGEIDATLVKEAITSGNIWALDWHYPGILEDETSQETVRDATEILSMWSLIEHSHSELSEEEKARVAEHAGIFGREVVFRGFDGNSEGKYLSVARLLITKMERYGEFAGRDLNAHMPTLDTYHRMMKPFKRATEGNYGAQPLTAGQLIEILSEQVHPENR